MVLLSFGIGHLIGNRDQAECITLAMGILHIGAMSEQKINETSTLTGIDAHIDRLDHKLGVFTNHHIQTAEKKTLNDIGIVMIVRGDTATKTIGCHIIGLTSVETEMIIIIKHKVIQIVDIILVKDLMRGN